ncbi:helix-turn-helix domain-containing protein [Vibrio kanaloae]|uniref:helix-turn-helix domain-containing protein n=1 Tax=Vibrio kanaloae TaxID=170673 RepID=UPI0018E48D3A|nr:S24 family peptidase [Vibrio kanaloae]
MINQWMTPKEIALLPTMPNTIQGVHKKAKREHWQSRKQKGVKGPGIEYELPKEFSIDKPVDEMSVRESETVYINKFTDEFALIPGYRIQVSAGHGSLNPEQLEPTRHLAFRRKWLKFRGFNEKDLAIVWAKGDSMEPTIHNNDTLVVNMARKKPSDGHIYIFRNGEELFVKRYQSALGSWRLISDNLIYDKLDIPKEEQHQFEVIGQVVHIAKDLGD